MHSLICVQRKAWGVNKGNFVRLETSFSDLLRLTLNPRGFTLNPPRVSDALEFFDLCTEKGVGCEQGKLVYG